jgi:hypothetical protein
MNVKENDIIDAVRAIHSANFSRRALDLLDQIIDQQAVSRLVSVLVSNARESGKTQEDALEQAMAELESLGNTSKPVACILMASLWPIAAAVVGMHDICDAIDLWIDDCNSERLNTQLEFLARSVGDGRIRKHYDEWIENKRKRAV